VKLRPLKVFGLVVAALLSLSVAGAAARPAVGTAAEAPAPSLKLRIGVVLPLTGQLSGFGPSLNQGARIAVQQINAALRRQKLANRISVTMFSEDGQTQAAAGVEAATKLVKVNKVQIVVGEMASSVTIPIAQSVAIPNNVVQITPTSTAAAISDLDDKGLVYRILATDALQGRALATAVGNAVGRRSTVNVGARNDAFGVGLKNLFETQWRRNGGQIGESLTWDPNAPSLDSEAQRLARGRPAAFVIIDFLPSFSKLAPPLVRSGSWDPRRTFVNEAIRNKEELDKIGGGRALEGLRGTAPTSEGAPARAPFDNLFKRQAPSNTPLTGFEGAAFDSVMLGFLASVKARSTSPSRIKLHLRAVSGPPGKKYTYLQLGAAIKALLAGKDVDYEGAWGPVDWDAKGDPGSAVYEVWRYQGGAISTLTRFTFK
jgi:ABC-type branched-subunit amino acid transport system substrate-binding protein